MQLILGNGSLNERDETGGLLCIARRLSAASRTAVVSDFFAIGCAHVRSRAEMQLQRRDNTVCARVALTTFVQHSYMQSCHSLLTIRPSYLKGQPAVPSNVVRMEVRRVSASEGRLFESERRISLSLL